MHCDTEGCGAEATVHETLIRNGKKVERHLCEKCARKQGIVYQTPVPINELLSKIVMSQGLAPEPGAKSGVCPGCGMTWAHFRQKGLLGCGECYKTFEKELMPLIERAHEGGATHTGKSPRRAGSRSEILHGRLASLRRQLQEAVAAEQYERAAALRDQLREVSGMFPSSGEVEP
ncbi:MAG: UvrB/UvrC motif-containing protein [Phycisphaerales bacterium]|nr:UvrB/UvrC motif-containing protein [Phycisphaerales bacterium]